MYKLNRKCLVTILVTVMCLINTNSAVAHRNGAAVVQPLDYKQMYMRKAQTPNTFTMAADTVVARPLGLGALAVGAVVFVVSLPFSILGGNPGQAMDELVKEPFDEVLQRCLGCT